MQVLIVIDAQNEFSQNGKRPVSNFLSAIEAISKRVKEARSESRPIAWVRHFNQPHESPAFIPNTWGGEFYSGFGPKPGNKLEKEFQKNVYGAFTGTDIGSWLKTVNGDSVLIAGFYTHGCVSTTSREAIMANLGVSLDPDATGSCDMAHEILGKLTADEVRRSALLQLANMGANISPFKTDSI
jgi:nicotinamidase-related amidase